MAKRQAEIPEPTQTTESQMLETVGATYIAMPLMMNASHIESLMKAVLRNHGPDGVGVLINYVSHRRPQLRGVLNMMNTNLMAIVRRDARLESGQD